MSMRNVHRTVLKRARSRTAFAGRLCVPRRARAFVHGSLSLAAAIAARYATLERRWPALALVLSDREEPGGALRQTSLATHTSIFLNPRLILCMPVTSRPEVLRTAERGVPAGWKDDTLRVQPVSHGAERPAPAAATTGIIERIVRRTLREERIGRSAALPASPGSWQITGPVAGTVAPASSSSSGVVVRRGQKPGDDRWADRERREAEPERSPDAAARKSPASAPPQADITRITDQVLQMLDRRIVAQRERMGRV